ncbi:unnamed protein product [Bursaphelenchus xylophilus]|uniref:(pine wood nematode) hypothetical protein n=1 Tax=Bursaphelenchus xylophilus TaxID=6326 RepID=A0A1I7SLQ6_BURXY|nr:unnamed protein product [Bursaphelenchus xylophilus]CAG9129703.1 unnamed protein product [Bursaphelenchus xylophilus]
MRVILVIFFAIFVANASLFKLNYPNSIPYQPSIYDLNLQQAYPWQTNPNPGNGNNNGGSRTPPRSRPPSPVRGNNGAVDANDLNNRLQDLARGGWNQRSSRGGGWGSGGGFGGGGRGWGGGGYAGGIG